MGYTEEELRLAEGGDVAELTIEAWYMDDSVADQRLPHRQTPNKPCSPDALRQLGVLAWRLDADGWQADPQLRTIRAVRGYNYEEVVTISPDKLPGYEAKLKAFYEEHIHSDEEIRFILDGRGYFDVRDLEDRWVRIACCKGDMIVLPAGIYHRFSLDEDNYALALRLFVGDPVWTPINRPCDDQPARASYLTQFKVAAS